MLNVYMLMTLIMAVSAIWNGAIYAGFAGIVGPTLCWAAACGLKGSLLVGTSPEKLGGLGAAIAFVAVGIGMVYHAGYRVFIFEYEFTGITWCLIGLAVGWIITTREKAVGTESTTNLAAEESR